MNIQDKVTVFTEEMKRKGYISEFIQVEDFAEGPKSLEDCMLGAYAEQQFFARNGMMFRTTRAVEDGSGTKIELSMKVVDHGEGLSVKRLTANHHAADWTHLSKSIIDCKDMALVPLWTELVAVVQTASELVASVVHGVTRMLEMLLGAGYDQHYSWAGMRLDPASLPYWVGTELASTGVLNALPISFKTAGYNQSSEDHTRDDFRFDFDIHKGELRLFQLSAFRLNEQGEVLKQRQIQFSEHLDLPKRLELSASMDGDQRQSSRMRKGF